MRHLHRLSRLLMVAIAAFMAAYMTSVPSHAVEPDEMLVQPQSWKPALAPSPKNCGVSSARTESIDDLGAPLAHDLRVLVRQRLVAGDNDAQILTFSGVALRRVCSAPAATVVAYVGLVGNAACGFVDRHHHDLYRAAGAGGMQPVFARNAGPPWKRRVSPKSSTANPLPDLAVSTCEEFARSPARSSRA